MNRKEIQAIVKFGNGSTQTKKARDAVLTRIASQLKRDLNIQYKSFARLKSEDCERLVKLWKEQGLQPGTVQNRMSIVRLALRYHGREKFASNPRIKNSALGAEKRSRAGTHTVPPKQVILERIEALPPGHKEAAMLQLTLGLRKQEAVSSYRELDTWENRLLANKDLPVISGTKNGRPRDIHIETQKHRDEALAAVRAAKQVASTQSGWLVVSQTLQGANKAYEREMQKVGFKGSEATHCLRYQFAWEQKQRYLAAGYSSSSADSRLSQDLGHGDGRGRYCRQVYLRGRGEESESEDSISV